MSVKYLQMKHNSNAIDKTSKKTSPKAQWTQGIQYFDSLNISSSKQKVQQILVKFQLGIHLTTLTNPTIRSKLNKNITDSVSNKARQ